MSMPFGYVSPEQVMKDRADYARKGIARGRAVLVMTYADGILFVAENPSSALHKISEIYDRIGFAAVGKYNEFENLRQAGVRMADLRGYSYDRSDVTGRMLANTYAQILGTIFTTESKPPKESTAERTPSTTDCSSAMFISNVVRRSPPPASAAWARVLSSPSAATSAATTAAPSSNRRSAVAWPIPDAAPVTRIRLPASRIICAPI